MRSNSPLHKTEPGTMAYEAFIRRPCAGRIQASARAVSSTQRNATGLWL
jgi:hypothetical protein